jgi:Leucine-rich repeat (LRR) protein
MKINKFIVLFLLTTTCISKNNKIVSYRFYDLNIASEHKDDVRDLILIGNELNEFPDEIYHYKRLELLRLSHNNIQLIPTGICSLKYLKRLEISDNKLKDFNSLTCLSNLEFLDLMINELQSLPEDMGNLVSLKELYLTSNPLTNLGGLGKLANIEILVISNCGFDGIPLEILELKTLKKLDLSANKIMEIPDAIAGLTELETIMIEDNPISSEELNRLSELLPNVYIHSHDPY